MPESERSGSVEQDYFCPRCDKLWSRCRCPGEPSIEARPTDKGAEERCSECGCELDPAFAWCLGCSTTLNQRVEELEAVLRRIGDVADKSLVDLGYHKRPDLARIARSALSQQDSKP